ncbi:hypothetical protein ACFQ1E_19560 [Sphingomonas canadensis]|uniref:DUF3618 domain-containing protein n=1 Tax=Sphingomonas canadensis TaxID=1219257 RepID=A0ABW3HAM5_9SPHN|nr:hypothetical protein [Sphingomonas canadensis]MCW3838266.1 hypothetical protein [Sphingomonas canadensis]
MNKPPATPAPKKPRAKPATPRRAPAKAAPRAPAVKEEASEAVAVAREMAEARKRWSPNAKQIGVGAAIGVGSAAVVAALLYWRGTRR